MKNTNIQVGEINKRKLLDFIPKEPGYIFDSFDTDFRGEILDIIDLRDELIIKTTTGYYITMYNRKDISTMQFNSFKGAIAFYLSSTHYNSIIILSNN